MQSLESNTLYCSNPRLLRRQLGESPMPSTAKEVYNEIIQSLSPKEQFRLATLIMNKLVQQDLPVIDQQDYWTEEDQTDIVNFSLAYATSIFPEEEAV